MMITPNSHARQKEVAQGEEDEEAGDRKRKAKQDLRRLARTIPQVKLGQGCRMRGTA